MRVLDSVKRVSGEGLAALGGQAAVGQGVPLPGGVLLVGPGHPVGRGAGPGRGGDLRLQLDHPPAPPPPPAEEEEGPELLAEGGVEAAVDEGVVAGGAHGQPVEAEVEGVGGVDGVAGQQHHVAVERKPADGEDAHHQEQHGQRAPPLPPLVGVLGHGGGADGVVAAQPARYRGVGGGDDEQRQHVEQDEGQQVDVLPVEVGRLGEVRDAQAALHLLAGGHKDVVMS